MCLSKIIKIGLLGLIVVSLSSCGTSKINSDTKKTTTDIIAKIPFVKEHFPQDWIGRFKGELQIYSVDSIAMTANMQLDISKKTDSLYQWIITYNIKGKEDVRSYELQVINSKKGHFLIDEKNSIKIDAFYRNKIFTSFFKVMNSYIVATYTKENDHIIFEIISASDEKTTTTGNTKFKDEDIPEVVTYFVNGRQKAILVKQE
jgi:hypothetical protein